MKLKMDGTIKNICSEWYTSSCRIKWVSNIQPEKLCWMT